MKKIKIFYDPIEQLAIWLNKIARQGYRLKSVKSCLYTFEKTSTSVSYSVEFIGYDDNKKNIKYIDMLEDSGFNTFRAPLNQLNFAVGKVRLRPMASNGAKISTSFDNYNKELLIIESEGNVPHETLTTNLDKAFAYKKIRNAYIQGLIGILILVCAVFYRFAKQNYKIDYLTVILGVVVLLLLVFVASLAIKIHIKFKDFSRKAKLRE